MSEVLFGPDIRLFGEQLIETFQASACGNYRESLGQMNNGFLAVELCRKVASKKAIAGFCLAGEDIKRGPKGFFGNRERSGEASIVIDVHEAHRPALSRESGGDVDRRRGLTHATLLISKRDEPSERRSSHISKSLKRRRQTGYVG